MLHLKTFWTVKITQKSYQNAAPQNFLNSKDYIETVSECYTSNFLNSKYYIESVSECVKIT